MSISFMAASTSNGSSVSGTAISGTEASASCSAANSAISWAVSVSISAGMTRSCWTSGISGRTSVLISDSLFSIDCSSRSKYSSSELIAVLCHIDIRQASLHIPSSSPRNHLSPPALNNNIPGSLLPCNYPLYSPSSLQSLSPQHSNTPRALTRSP